VKPPAPPGDNLRGVISPGGAGGLAATSHLRTRRRSARISSETSDSVGSASHAGKTGGSISAKSRQSSRAASTESVWVKKRAGTIGKKGRRQGRRAGSPQALDAGPPLRLEGLAHVADDLLPGEAIANRPARCRNVQRPVCHENDNSANDSIGVRAARQSTGRAM
jgi:hypothetical protein